MIVTDIKAYNVSSSYLKIEISFIYNGENHDMSVNIDVTGSMKKSSLEKAILTNLNESSYSGYFESVHIPDKLYEKLIMSEHWTGYVFGNIRKFTDSSEFHEYVKIRRKLSKKVKIEEIIAFRYGNLVKFSIKFTYNGDTIKRITGWSRHGILQYSVSPVTLILSTILKHVDRDTYDTLKSYGDFRNNKLFYLIVPDDLIYGIEQALRDSTNDEYFNRVFPKNIRETYKRLYSMKKISS